MKQEPSIILEGLNYEMEKKFFLIKKIMKWNRLDEF